MESTRPNPTTATPGTLPASSGLTLFLAVSLLCCPARRFLLAPIRRRRRLTDPAPPRAAHIYAKAFKWGAVVFGAIPSLHAATSICCGLYATRYSKSYRGLTFMWIYCFWMFWSTQYLHHHVSFSKTNLAQRQFSDFLSRMRFTQFAIDLLFGTFYSAVAFTIFERVRLRKLDLRHYSEGRTTGWERLWYSLHDGENYTEYGSRQILRLSNGAKDALSSEVLSRSSSGGGSVQMGATTRQAGGANGYAAVPTDRPSWDDESRGSIDVDGKESRV